MPQSFPFPPSRANRNFPYNPFGPHGPTGDPDDSAAYIQPPGVAFYRPWVAIPNGPAFIWPLGTEGFRRVISPTIGVHKYVGDNHIEVNVIHRGDERITLNGVFPGDTAPDSMRALADLVLSVQPTGGKILYLPGILTYAQRVAIGETSFERSEDERTKSLAYSIEFYRLGNQIKYEDPLLQQPRAQPVPGKGGSERVFKTTSSVNTLRKIAQAKLKSSAKWRSIYEKNEKVFVRLKVPMHNVPDYKLKNGTRIYW